MNSRPTYNELINALEKIKEVTENPHYPFVKVGTQDIARKIAEEILNRLDTSPTPTKITTP